MLEDNIKMKKNEAKKRIEELRKQTEYHAKKYYDEDGEMSDMEIIEEMKKHKALNMYHFLQKNKEQLHLLKDDKLAAMLIKAKEYIESHYGTYTHPA